MKHRTSTATFTLLAAGAASILGVACADPAGPARARGPGDGVPANAVPDEIRAEYTLFTQRCSKCHSLARVLNNGEHDEPYWKRYVTRMRRQPSSGIAPEDEAPIVRYLLFHSARLREDSARGLGAAPALAPASAPDAGPAAAQP